MLKLFHAPGVCSLASLIALEESGAAFETVIVDLASGEQNEPAYRAINPKGRVPALATESCVLTENPAIMVYIAMIAPEARLAPLGDPLLFARMQSFNAYLASGIQPGLSPIARPERFTDDVSAHAGLRAKAAASAETHFGLIEDELLAGPWVLGDTYSVADGYLFTFSDVITRLGMDATRFPRILAHRELMEQRPAVVRALAANR